MKTETLVNLVLAGELVAVVEFRGASAQRYESKGKPGSDDFQAESVCITYRVELKDGKQQEIRNYLKDANEVRNFDEKKFNAGAMPFKKGDRCVWHIKAYSWTERGTKATGSLEILEK